MDRAVPATHPHRLPWLARVSFQRKLLLVVGIPSLVALVGTLLALNRVTATYRRSRVLETANASSSLMIQAAAAQAKERGFTAAVLSDPGAQATRNLIFDLRATGDRLLDSALAEGRFALRGNAVLAAADSALRKARQLRDFKRTEVDALLLREERAEQTQVQAWFDTQTRLIDREREYSSTLFLAQNPYELIIQFNGYIKGNVFVASEYAGRERARIGRFIASGQPIPSERLEELQRWRGVVDENLAAISRLRANPAMSASVLRSIEKMETVFLGDYQKARFAVYAASAHGQPYPLTTDEWIAISTRSIDSIIAVSDQIGATSAAISHQQASFSLANVLLIMGMLGLLAVAVVASVYVARHLTSRLADLRAAAERVTQGIYSQPVGEAAAASFTRDEFTKLAAVFNLMQVKVEAGIEHLRQEKAGVEARVQERTRELSDANSRLVSLNADKDRFLGICSHDLKNPLSGIVGLAELLQGDAGDPATVRSHAADILHSAEFMFHLVTNLLDVGAIEQGKFRLHPEPLDLGALAARVVSGYQRRAADKRIQLSFAAPVEAVVIQADARAMTQVLDNLVSNGVKYTPLGGEVTVSVTLGTKDPPEGSARGSVAEFSVRDTGPGLSEADQARLFQKYVRLSSRTTGGEGSTGLGLSIVKSLAEAMGGTVLCQSEIDRGSRFTVTFPALQAPDGVS